MSSRTFAMVKPIWNGAYTLSDVLRFIENRFFLIEELRLRRLLPVHVDEFYQEHVGKPFYAAMREYMCSGPVVGMVLSMEDDSPVLLLGRDEPEGAIYAWRRFLGATDSSKADPRTLRHLYGNKTGILFQNVAHGSDSPEAAVREAGLWGWTLDAKTKENT